MSLIARARALAEKTPPHRDRTVDFLRAVSILVVVFGHWTMAVITIEDGRIVARNVLAEAPWTQFLTWLLQVMPVFFIVGGYSNATSWDAAMRKGEGYAGWLRSRCRRLLAPTVLFALAWVPVAILASRIAPDRDVLVLGGQLVAVPLWFMAVYLAVVPIAPGMLWLHRRLGLLVPLGFAAATIAVDFLDPTRHVKGEAIRISWGWINYLFVWLAIHQIGFFWRDGALSRLRATGWLLAAGGLGTLIAVTAAGLYPVSMIGVPGQQTNNTPPTLALLLLATFQTGIILLVSPALKRWLARIGPWSWTILANGMIMTLYLWHLTAMVLAILAGRALGWRFGLEPPSAAWWLSRLVWLAALAIILAIFVTVFGRFERPSPPPSSPPGAISAVLAAVGALAAAAGLGMLAAQGLVTPGGSWGFPAGALILLLAGAGTAATVPFARRAEG